MDETRTTRRRWPLLVVLFAALALFAAACSDDDKTTSASAGNSDSGAPTSSGTVACSPNAPSVDYPSLTGTLNGSGSSFQDVFNQEAKKQFAPIASGVTVNYTKSGSSAGKTDLQNQVVQFAGTDSLIKDADKPSYKGGEVLYFPTVGAPITVSYNLSNVKNLQLSPETLAGIMQAKITTWNDPSVAADNPGATLPSTPIAVVHRSDGSGTTNNFTSYLTKAAGTLWTLGSGDTVNWPASTQGAEKNSGVASLIQSTDGAIGYVDLADAVNADLQLASIKNAAGTYTKPTLDAAAAALAGASVNPDLTYNPLDPSGSDAYPITSPTWIIVYKKQPDANTAAALKGWLQYILTDGQAIAETVGFAPLPCELAQKAIDQLSQISA